MTIKLIVSQPEISGEPLIERTIEKEAMTLGRSKSNDIVLPDLGMRVSGSHARVEKRGNSWFLADLKSKNGTFLDGRRLEADQQALLQNGAIFVIEDFEIQFLEDKPDLEQTMERVDPSLRAGRLADEVSATYAAHACDPPRVRKEAIRGTLRAATKGINPQVARLLCAQVRSRFESGSRVAEELREPASDTDIRKREACYAAGYQAMRALSDKLLGTKAFESAEDLESFGKLVEQTLQVTLDWLSNCLKGRREFEKQFGADLTLIFSREGNPIKNEEASPDGMGKFLLDWQGGVDHGARRLALEGAFKDLTLHQLGLLSGVQLCLKTLLERVDPKAIEERVREEAKDPLSRLLLKLFLEKRAWRQYSLWHGEMFQENSKLFNELIYPNIRKGYLGSHAAPDSQDKQGGP